MAAVVETTAPHLRVSAAKASKKEPESTRIQAPEALVDDHFFWTYTEEPHRSRRQAIIKAHPEVCDNIP
jgi:sphingolipid delta-4 desaturase